ncbi:uncharacterized protein BDW43DRAFT_260509 [Aspergillus alliaceus]|uniref:uncharacterized protein n=1 Tax=Petromyces alliaceus TaxID=209559 RepID=UPI0012A41BED|nr:uncharacterized protein BDW43DRAFT_260509 [Aspergillus alliaceus]KAB8239070.1 hypothetical protein BDW43DRAFT_260509 [Aspergillus alliaceus]
MAIPPAGTPVGLEIPAKDVARGKHPATSCSTFPNRTLTRHFAGSAFYKAVFNWTFAPSTLGLPANKLLTFEVPGGVFPIGGALRRVDELATTQGTKLYLYVEDMSAAIEVSDSSAYAGVEEI